MESKTWFGVKIQRAAQVMFGAIRQKNCADEAALPSMV
jgi:hypothetical protein